MKKVNLDEWLKMSEKDRGENYKYLTDHEKFQVRTCYTIPKGETIEPEIKMSEEELRKKQEEAYKILVEHGILTQEQANKALAKK